MNTIVKELHDFDYLKRINEKDYNVVKEFVNKCVEYFKENITDFDMSTFNNTNNTHLLMLTNIVNAQSNKDEIDIIFNNIEEYSYKDIITKDIDTDTCMYSFDLLMNIYTQLK